MADISGVPTQNHEKGERAVKQCAKSFEKHSGKTESLTPIQSEIVSILRNSSPIEPTDLIQRLGKKVNQRTSNESSPHCGTWRKQEERSKVIESCGVYGRQVSR
jgi:hypothetical protein